MKILISGCGIAGATLAYWLKRFGHEPTIVEKSPQLRTGGYIIDFWGSGYDIAEKMDLLPEIRSKGYMVEGIRIVDGMGRKVGGFPTKIIGEITGGRYVSLPRGDLASLIFEKIRGQVEIILGDSIKQINDKHDMTIVEFEHSSPRVFDLVIGADGLHSVVRNLVFGRQNEFEKYLGYKVAAFEVQGYPEKDPLVYLMFTEVGKQVARFTMSENRTMFLFVFADDVYNHDDFSIQGQKKLIYETFGSSAWEVPQILRALENSKELYFDRVSQIRMPGWHKGRITLVGDAAFCVSLLAGQGSALAMVASYILAGELHRTSGDFLEAFKQYEQIFGPFVMGKQIAARRFASSFAPKSAISLFLRNQATKFLSIKPLAKIAIGGDIVDRISLPDY